MGANPSRYKGDNQPVENVSWDDIQKFIEKLNAQEGRSIYRLPTEAEWEYAARAGSTTAYHFGDDEAQLGDYAWYKTNAGDTPHPVGQKQANTWGLYDMHGNVWEWVQDWYGPYKADAVTDPKGPDAGALRVVRGGGWYYGARLARSADRLWLHPGSRAGFLGFRCLSSGPSQ
jgi:formylglycine-generating enzyme required for sulfatase activity